MNQTIHIFAAAWDVNDPVSIVGDLFFTLLKIVLALIVVGGLVIAAAYFASAKEEKLDEERYKNEVKTALAPHYDVTPFEKNLLTEFKVKRNYQALFNKAGIYAKELVNEDEVRESAAVPEYEYKYPELISTREKDDGYVLEYRLPDGMTQAQFTNRIELIGDLDVDYKAVSTINGRGAIYIVSREQPGASSADLSEFF